MYDGLHAEIQLEHRRVQLTRDAVFALLEHREAVAAAGNKGVHHHAVGRVHRHGLAVQHERSGHHTPPLSGCGAAGGRCVPGVAKALRDSHDLPVAGLALPLLLEHAHNLRAGQVHADQVVGKRYHAEQLPEGYAQRAAQLAPDTARAYQGNLCARVAALRCRSAGQKCIGDQGAQSAFACRRSLAQQGGGDAPDHDVGHGGTEIAIARDQGRKLRIGRQRRVVAGVWRVVAVVDDHVVARLFG